MALFFREKIMVNADVPEISEEFKNIKLGAENIKWVKTVTDNKTFSAYIPPDSRVLEMPDTILFCLQVNKQFTDSLSLAKVGDMILLYQNLNDTSNKKIVKCLTHLVAPIDDNVVQKPYDGEWLGRWVKVIAMTKSGIVSSIRFENTKWSTIGFENKTHRLLSYQDGSIRKINHNQQLSDEKLLELQNDIWNRFNYFLK
jgi:hypothetical protein